MHCSRNEDSPRPHHSYPKRPVDTRSSPSAASDPFRIPSSQLWKLRNKDILSCLACPLSGSLGSPTPTSSDNAGTRGEAMYDGYRGGRGHSLLLALLASTHQSLGLGGTLNLLPGSGCSRCEPQRRPPGVAIWVLYHADQTGGVGWVILQLRIRGDCKPFVMLRSRRCKANHHYQALSRLSNGGGPFPIPEGVGHTPPFSTRFLLPQTRRDYFTLVCLVKAINRKV